MPGVFGGPLCKDLAKSQPARRKECVSVRVHSEEMKDSDTETCLGDFIRSDGKIYSTINDRTRRAYSYLSEIIALLSDMPFGKRRLQIGLLLRDAMSVSRTIPAPHYSRGMELHKQ